MTCKTHEILKALRKLREEGYTGKINPSMIRELTGIESPGRTMCSMRNKRYLIDAGEIYLPAARGKTKANLYTINPESDLMPKDNRAATIQKRKRDSGMAQNSKTSDIRKAIKSYHGQAYSTSQVRKDVGMYAHTYQRLEYLESLGEIKRVGLVKTGGRSSMTWVELKINDALIFEAASASVDAKQSANPWAGVWPEFFRLPNLQGTMRSFCEAA